jgi:pre-rRNA-processing protein TSR3
MDVTAMKKHPATIVLRHQRENLKKCSLRGLEKRSEFHFLTYPCRELPNLANYVLLAVEAPPLSAEDNSKGLFVLDATWRYAEKMVRFVETQVDIPRRSIPQGFTTAYPRRQDDCPDPSAGLASIEAIYIAYRLLGRPLEGLLDGYYWREQFLKQNQLL